jgi:hypothetical protein
MEDGISAVVPPFPDNFVALGAIERVIATLPGNHYAIKATASGADGGGTPPAPQSSPVSNVFSF